MNVRPFARVIAQKVVQDVQKLALMVAVATCLRSPDIIENHVADFRQTFVV